MDTGELPRTNERNQRFELGAEEIEIAVTRLARDVVVPWERWKWRARRASLGSVVA